MNLLKAAGAALLIFTVSVAPLLAHHSIAGTYDASKVMTLKGVITSVELKNPHGWISLNGRIRNDNNAGPLVTGADRLRVQLRGLTVGLTVSHSAVDADGGFRIESISPAEYRVVAPNVPPELYVKDILLGGVDLMNQTLRVAEGAPIAGTLDVIVSPNVSQIDGAVLDDRGLPMPGVQAVLVPDRNRDHAELFRAATTDQTGHYTMRGLPPGDYKLFAWETLESFGYFDPDLLKRSEPQAKAVHIVELSKQNFDIVAIRP